MRNFLIAIAVIVLAAVTWHWFGSSTATPAPANVPDVTVTEPAAPEATPAPAKP